MLTNENPNAPNAEQLSVAFREAAAAARRLGHKLVTGAHNENPHNERNLPNPGNTVVYIRPVRPRVQVIVPVDEETKLHNDFVSSLGAQGVKFQ